MGRSDGMMMLGGPSGMEVSRGMLSFGVNLYMIVEMAKSALLTASEPPAICEIKTHVVT